MLKPDSRGMTVLLAFMTAMGPISTDLYVPALPQLATEFGVTPARVQWTLSSYLMGFAVGQLAYGPLSDKYGRKPLLMLGFAAYLIGTIASAFATSIEGLTLARMLQGIGGAGPIIIARAIVRDMYEGARAGRQLSLMSTIMGIAPIASPVLGGFLAVWFGWRASFVDHARDGRADRRARLRLSARNAAPSRRPGRSACAPSAPASPSSRAIACGASMRPSWR